MMGENTYRPEIDGLRGIAIALVITFHAFPSALPGGWVGVDVFFVVSGYLITSLILRQLRLGEFSLSEFFRRRVRRLAPAFIVVISLTTLVSWLTLAPSRMPDVSLSAFAALTGWSNFYFLAEMGDYFAPPTSRQPLIHTWSLSVEEQFYLVFPLLLILLFRWNRGRLSIWIAGLLAGSFLLALFGGLDGESTYFLLPTRMWELLVGSYLAVLPSKGAQRNPRAHPLWTGVGGAGLLAIISAGFWTPSSNYMALSSVAPVLGTALVLISSTKDSTLRTWLEFSPLRYGGLISYSLYLIHQPFLVFARSLFFETPTLGIIVAISASIVFAIVSYRYIETPFRNPQSMPWRRLRLPTAAAFGATLTAVALMSTSLLPGRPWSYPEIAVPGYEVGELDMREESWTLLRSGSPESAEDVSNFETEWFSARDARTPLLIVGNSHSKDLYNTLVYSDTAERHFQVGRIGSQVRKIGIESALYETESYIGASLVVIATRLSEDDIGNLRAVIQQIQRDGKEAMVALDAPLVELATPDGWIWLDRLVSDQDNLAIDPAQVADEVNREFYRILQETGDSEAVTRARHIAQATGATILERRDYMCEPSKRTCFGMGPDLTKFLYDGGHHSLAGAQFFGQRIDAVNWLEPLIRE